MSFFSKYDPEVMIVFQIREHHAKIVKLGRYGSCSRINKADLHVYYHFGGWGKTSCNE